MSATSTLPAPPPSPRRYLAVYLPTWPTDRLQRRRARGRGELSTPLALGEAPSAGRRPFILLAETKGNQRLIAACCGASAQAGVRGGMSVAHATALLPAGARIVVRDHAPVEDASALLALARWAMRFSPAVAPDYPDGLMLNVTGCQRLYGGDERLAALVMQSIRALGLDARVAIAPTIGAAWAVARFATDQRRINAKAQRAQRENKEEKREEGGVVARQRGAAARMRPVARNFAAVSMPDDRRDLNSSAFAPSLRLCVVPGWRVVSEHEWPALFQRLPIAALRVERKVVDELAEVGIDHVRQLLAIPRDEIASRFDADVLLRIDQATGEAMEMLRPLRHEEPPAVAIRFAGPTTQFEAVEQASRKLVEMLCNRLLKREAGARRIVLEVERMNQDLHPEFAQEVLTLSRPSRSAKHLWNLLRPRVERLHLGEGVEQLSLTARRCAPLPHEQEQLDGSSGESEAATTARLQEAAGQLIDLLESRLGPPAVLAGEIVQTHIPEASFRFRPASEGGLKMTPAPRADSRVISPDPAAADAVEATSTFIPLPGDRPTVLFDEPEAVAVTLLQPEGPVIGLQWRRLHRITTAIGPERIGRRWWHFRLTRRQPARDYYRLQDEEGLWLWVYRSRFSRKWFVHGVWS